MNTPGIGTDTDQTMQPVRAVICDLGRVIVDFDHRAICSRLAACTPLSADAIYAALFSSGLEASFDRGELSGDQFYHHAARQLNLTIGLDRFRAIWSAIFTLIPETAALLKRLHVERLLLLSNTNAWHFSYCRRHFPILDIFDAVILSYEIGARKPEPLIFQHALAHATVPAPACLYIDDMPGNVAAARQAGMQALHFTSPAAATDERI